MALFTCHACVPIVHYLHFSHKCEKCEVLGAGMPFALQAFCYVWRTTRTLHAFTLLVVKKIKWRASKDLIGIFLELVTSNFPLTFIGNKLKLIPQITPIFMHEIFDKRCRMVGKVIFDQCLQFRTQSTLFGISDNGLEFVRI